MVEWLIGNIGWLIFTGVIIGGGFWVASLIKKAKQRIKSVLGDFDDIVELAKIGEIEAKKPKSIGGTTNLYLDRIKNDFPDFHAPDAESAIKTFVIEYLHIKYEGQKDFVKSKVNENILLNVEKEETKNVGNIVINGIAIYAYQKSQDYATVTYRVSVGFNLDGDRVETRYEVNYTLQLSDNSIPTLHMKCNNCGAAFDNTRDTHCKYCGAAVIKDTIMNWNVTKIRAI